MAGRVLWSIHRAVVITESSAGAGVDTADFTEVLPYSDVVIVGKGKNPREGPGEPSCKNKNGLLVSAISGKNCGRSGGEKLRPIAAVIHSLSGQ